MNLDDELSGVSEAHYGDNYSDHLMTMYRDYVTSADNISRRRQIANTFFLSINTALLGMTAKEGIGIAIGGEMIWLVSVAAIVFCLVWREMILSYSNLNSAKFTVINEIEKRLPVKPYYAEWELKKHREGSGKSTLTKVEKWVPYIFIGLHSVVVIVSVGAAALSLFIQFWSQTNAAS
jgi:hypothetical protein